LKSIVLPPLRPRFAVALRRLLAAGCGGLLAGAVAAGAAPVRTGPAEYLIDAWQTSDGLPHNSVNGLTVGPDGYLWVATAGGVARFDGVQFTAYRAGETGLPDSRALTLFVDRQRHLWAGVVGGCAQWTNGGWCGIALAADGVPGDVRAFAEDAAGDFWFGSNTGLDRWRDGVREHFTPPRGPAEAVRSLLLQPDGTLLVLTAASLYEFRDGTFRGFDGIAAATGGRELWTLGRDQHGAVWVGGNNVLLRREGDHWTPMDAGEATLDGHHVAFLAARNGDIWVATRNRGVHRWRAGHWLHLSTENGLAHDDVRALCEDAQGDIWIGSNGGGLNRLKRRHLEVLSRESGLGHHVTSALTQSPDGTVWIGTDGGGVWRAAAGVVEPFLSAPGFVPDAFVWSLCATHDGALWLGTFNQGLFRREATGVQQYLNSHGLESTWLTALFEDRAGGMWVGTHPGGVFRFDGTNFAGVRRVDTGRHAAITAFAETDDGTIWIGTGGDGLMRWAGGQLTWLRTTNAIPANNVAALHEDAAGTLWIGSGAAGLGWLANGRFGRITRRDGLPDDAVLQIQSDAAGNLWLGGNLGLMRVSRASLDAFRAGRSQRVTAVLYDRSDGLPTTQFVSEHAPLSLRAADGSLWFSLASGVVRVDPAKVATQTNAPCLVIEQVQAGDRSLLPAPVRSDAVPQAVAPLVIPAGLNNVEFHYTALDLANPGKLRFMHKLEGLDADWQLAGAQRVANYRFVPPGTYHFRLRARNGEGVWTEPGVVVTLRVLPHFWQTWWFRVALFLLAAAGVAAGVRRVSLRRLQLRLARAEQERRVHQERARIAQDLHDDLGSSLTEISFLGALPRAEVSSPEALRERLGAIVQRSARLTKALDQIVWAVNPANDTLSATVNYLCSRVQESLRAAAVRCRLDVADNLPEVNLRAEVRNNLLLAANEAINNAMKYAGATEIWLRVHVREGRLEVVVEDNGRGFVVAVVADAGNGLGNMRRRLREIGGDCAVQSTPGQGTSVSFRVPLPD
jgi:ligand-binding sensor domain-containing protein/signal transduction histidine kinase